MAAANAFHSNLLALKNVKCLTCPWPYSERENLVISIQVPLWP